MQYLYVSVMSSWWATLLLMLKSTSFCQSVFILAYWRQEMTYSSHKSNISYLYSLQLASLNGIVSFFCWKTTSSHLSYVYLLSHFVTYAQRHFFTSMSFSIQYTWNMEVSSEILFDNWLHTISWFILSHWNTRALLQFFELSSQFVTYGKRRCLRHWVFLSTHREVEASNTTLLFIVSSLSKIYCRCITGFFSHIFVFLW